MIYFFPFKTCVVALIGTVSLGFIMCTSYEETKKTSHLDASFISGYSSWYNIKHFHSDGLPNTYWYNKYGIVHFVFMGLRS